MVAPTETYGIETKQNCLVPLAQCWERGNGVKVKNRGEA